MARSIDTIYQAILTEKANRPELAGLNSASNTAIYRLWAYITAVTISVLEQLWDDFKLEVEQLADRQIAGTLAWYAGKVYDFQYGDDLEFINNEYQYAVIDDTKRIVKRVAVTDTGGIVRISAAKLVGIQVSPLSEQEYSALLAYLQRIAFAGTQLELASLNADKLKMQATVYYNALLDKDTVKAAIKTAIEQYINTIPFDGFIYGNKLIDAIQAVDGVIDVELLAFDVKVGLGDYMPVGRVYKAISGYFELDAAFPLDTSISLFAQ